MRLIKCYVENFGLLHAQEYDFKKGINCCISDNGTGKTTLAAFIEAMLYGIGEGRKVLLDENPRKKYTPWQGGRFGGSLTFETGKKKYTVERSFGARAAEDTYRLVDASSGKEVSDFAENLGEELFGIDRDGFLRTVYLSEKNLQGKNENKSISAKLSDLVGVDGDVGGFDDALKLLEDRRKFYYKKGNAGEIANVKERIAECDRRLDSIARLKDEVLSKETELAGYKNELARLGILEKGEREKLVSISKQHEKLSHEERYSTMLASLRAEKEKLCHSKEFFRAGVPTSSDVDRARDAYLESQRLKGEAFGGDDSDELASLRRFFSRGTDFVEIGEMEREAILLSKREDELRKTEEGKDPVSIEMNSIFKGRIPTERELDAFSKKKKNVLPYVITSALGIVAVIIGIMFGGGAKFAIIGIGAAVVAISLILALKPQKDKELLAFLKDFDIDTTKNAEDALEEIRKSLNRYNALVQTRTSSIEALMEDIAESKRRIFPFLEKFPITDARDIIDAIAKIKLRYSKFFSMNEADAAREEGRLKKATKSDALYRQAMEFLAKYPTVSEDPFEEIRTKLNEYNYLTVTVQRMEGECDAYSVRHGVSGNAAPVNQENETAINNALSEISARREEIGRRHAVLEREIRLAYEEIDKRDETVSAKEELEELLKKHTESLDVIKKTSALLKEACNNITAKYLGKTKSGFEEYSRMIAGIDGEYYLSTDFEISKSDRGAPRGVEAYSRGMRDLYALAMRFALIDALYEQDSPFIILDDPFLALDDTKLGRAKELLKQMGRGKQILYFTCAKSRVID